MQTWEVHRVEGGSMSDVVKKANKMGEDGWEPVGLLEVRGDFVILLKRPKKLL